MLLVPEPLEPLDPEPDPELPVDEPEDAPEVDPVEDPEVDPDDPEVDPVDPEVDPGLTPTAVAGRPNRLLVKTSPALATCKAISAQKFPVST